MKTKKEHYKKVITWKQKPDYFGILCCISFTLVGFAMCGALLYYHEVPPNCCLLVAVFLSMAIFGLKKLEGTLPKGRKIRYVKVGRKK